MTTAILHLPDYAIKGSLNPQAQQPELKIHRVLEFFISPFSGTQKFRVTTDFHVATLLLTYKHSILTVALISANELLIIFFFLILLLEIFVWLYEYYDVDIAITVYISLQTETRPSI